MWATGGGGARRLRVSGVTGGVAGGRVRVPGGEAVGAVFLVVIVVLFAALRVRGGFGVALQKLAVLGATGGGRAAVSDAD